MMFDTSAYYGQQPGLMSSPFAPQGLFGQFPGQQGQGPWPPFGGGLGQPQLAGCATPGLFGYLPGQYAHPIGGALGHSQLAGFLPPPYGPAQFGVPTGPGLGGGLGIGPGIGGWPGQQLLAGQPGVGVGPFGRFLPFEAVLAMAALGFAPQISGWLPQPHLAGTLGRSIIPYQTAMPQMAYAGV